MERRARRGDRSIDLRCTKQQRSSLASDPELAPSAIWGTTHEYGVLCSSNELGRSPRQRPSRVRSRLAETFVLVLRHLAVCGEVPGCSTTLYLPERRDH